MLASVQRHSPSASHGGADPIRILIADKLAPEGAAYLRGEPGVEVTDQPGMAPDALVEALGAHDGVIVRSAVQLTADLLSQVMTKPGARLRGICRAGVGVDNIDLEAATGWGLAVMNSASASTVTTAEHAFALMLALARNVGPAYSTMVAGGWDRSKFVGRQLHGRTLGVVGLGRIGQTLARRALAFDMRVVGFDPFINQETILEGAVKLFSNFDDLLAEAEVISFHVPRTEATEHMMGPEQFALARPGVLIVNAARGGIVDETALLEAIDTGRCGGAALDVYDTEPLAQDSPLRQHPKILTTPHLGASTVEAQEAVAVDAARALVRYLRGQGVTGAVNVGGLQLDLDDRQQAFADLATRMVILLGAATHGAGFRGVKCTVRGAALAARADTIARVALAQLLSSHLDQPVNLINAAVLAEQRGIETETVITSDTGDDRLSIEIKGDERSFRVEGAVYGDGQPRVTLLDGYHLDMVPAGNMVLLSNADEPGRIGLVGAIFGEAGLNIAEMVIGRDRESSEDRSVAMMIIKVDTAPNEAVLQALRDAPGILSVATAVLT
jgi:D-3-phosphoglycerate dehydrogenase